jgi:tetratricopeptide (TPR) repeat protein
LASIESCGSVLRSLGNSSLSLIWRTIIQNRAGPICNYFVIWSIRRNAFKKFSSKSHRCSAIGSDKEANGLEKRGEAELARKIRQRIKAACTDQFGLPVDSDKFVCLSSADRLSKRGFSCEKQGAYELAAKLYGRVIDIYRDEIKSVSKAATSMTDLARIYTAENQIDKAKLLYERVFELYDQNPTFNDVERATFFEAYADFQSQHGSMPSAESLYKKAETLREAIDVRQKMKK